MMNLTGLTAGDLWAQMTEAERAQVRAAMPALAAALDGPPPRGPRVGPPDQPVTVSLDGGPALPAEVTLHGPEVVWARSEFAVMPDPSWRHVDGYGHEHRWALTSREDRHRPEALPTLRAVPTWIPCDGECGDPGCEGYTVTRHFCRECGELVEPHTIPDRQMREVGEPIRTGPATADVVIEGVAVPMGELLTERVQAGRFPVVIRRGDRQLTGEGSLDVTSWTRDGDGARVERVEVLVMLHEPAS